MDRFLPPLPQAARPWLCWLGVLGGLGLLGWALLDLRPVLTPIVTALAVAYTLHPLVSWLERRGVGRLPAVLGLYGVGLVLLLGLGLYLTLRTIEQAVALRDNISDYVQSVRQWLSVHGASRATQPAAELWWQEVGPLLQQHGVALANATLATLSGVFTNVLNWLSIFILIPLFAFFFLWHFERMIHNARALLPASSRDVIVHLVTTIDRAVADFFRGRLIACLIVGLVTGSGWTLVGVSYGLPLGALSGVLNLVPFLSLLALPPALLIRYFDAVQAATDWKWPVLLTMGVYVFAQALDAFVLTPAVSSRSSGLHPLTTVAALLIGAHWAGALGLLLAVPVASTLRALAGQYLLPELRRLAGPGSGAAPPATDPPPSRIEKSSP